MSWTEKRIWGLKEDDVFPTEDYRKGFTGFAVWAEEYLVCVELHKLCGEEPLEVRLERSVEVIVWRMLNVRCEEFIFHG